VHPSSKSRSSTPSIIRPGTQYGQPGATAIRASVAQKPQAEQANSALAPASADYFSVVGLVQQFVHTEFICRCWKLFVNHTDRLIKFSCLKNLHHKCGATDVRKKGSNT